DATSESPASPGSSTPLGKAIEVTRISCASENGTRLTTKCSVSRMFARVSFGSAGPLLPMPIPTVAGSLPNTLKKENGAAFTAPRASWVVTQAIGRGSTVASSSLYRSGASIASKSNCISALPDHSRRLLTHGNQYYLDINCILIFSERTVGLQSW